MKKVWKILFVCILLISSILITKDWIQGLFAAQSNNIVVTEEEAVINTYQKILPSVVSLITFRDQDNNGMITPTDTGGGTGFLVSSNGYIITNKHVVNDKNANYLAITSDGQEYRASVLARDPLFDIAIVKIEGSGFKPVTFGDSDKVQIGQTVLAIGNVLNEFPNSVTKGIVSGIGRTITASRGGLTETIEGTIQTDASINPGNSGGPLINLKGEVIGMNTAINRSGESLGFAIPINKIKQSYNIFLRKNEITRAFLGVRYVMLNRAVAQYYKVSSVTNGAYILTRDQEGNSGIVPGSPAEKAGLKVGDIVLELNNIKLSNTKSLGSVISNFSPSQEIRLKILRNGTELFINVVLGERKETD